MADVLAAVLPPHSPTCLGCGPQAPQGFHLRVRRDPDAADGVVAEHVFEDRHAGAPGIAHGGAVATVATVADDVLGALVFVVGEPAVTRHLSVDYLRPVLVAVPYVVRARLERRDGRKLFAACTGTGPDGEVAFRADALFIVVDRGHFDGPGPAVRP